METPKRMANKSEARDLKFGILHPGGPQTPTTMSKSSLTPVRNHDVLLDSLEDAVETPKRRTTKTACRDFKFGTLLPMDPQKQAQMSKYLLTPIRNQERPPRLLG